MADFLQPNQQQDPEALRKALLAKLFGGTSPPVAPGSAAAAPTTPTVAPASPAAQPLSPPPGPQPAKPLSAAPTPTVTESGNQPPPIMSETDWAKQNPQPAHTPYTPPDLKHRLLTGLFAGMQEFGRPGEGARTVANYGADIERKTEEEKNYPTTSAEATRKRYMDYVAGQKAPIDIEDLQAQIKERQAHARDLDAQAKARANPQDKMTHYVIDDPKNPGQPKAVDFNTKTGAYIDPDTKEAIPGAKPWEKPAPAGNDFEQYYKQWMKDTGKPDSAANRLAAHKEWEIKPVQPGANDTRMDHSYQYNNNIVEKQRAPIDQRLERLDRVEQAINQKSAQADALIAPELLTVMAGGQGSGLRMNEAEISRIVGGRSKLEDLKAVLNKWDPRTGGGLSVTDEQRQQMHELLKAVREKTEAKQHAFDEAQQDLIHAADVESHRRITAELKKKLSAIDSGGAQGAAAGGGQPGALPPGWK